MNGLVSNAMDTSCHLRARRTTALTLSESEWWSGGCGALNGRDADATVFG